MSKKQIDITPPADNHAPVAPEELQALQQQVSSLTEALQRERADAMNLRRRHDAEIAQLRNTVRVQVVTGLLPVIDNFERAMQHTPKELEQNEYIKGIQGIIKQFEKYLTDLGVQPIDALGQPFDPSLHEAVSMEEGDGAQEVVVAVLQRGYRMGDDVIRHAMVRVKAQ